MLHSTRGIVLKTVKYSENSIITKIYTEEFGLRSYIVKGITGKSGQRKKALLQGLTLLDMVVYEKPTSNLQNIKEMENAYAFKSIPFNIRKSTITMFLNEVIYKSLGEEVANAAMFNFIFDEITKLDQTEDLISEFHIRFLLKLTQHLGILPHNNFTENNCFFDLQEGNFIHDKPFHNNFLDKNQSLQLSLALSSEDGKICRNSWERNELLQKIILYYSFHIPTFGELKSFAILQQVFNS